MRAATNYMSYARLSPIRWSPHLAIVSSFELPSPESQVNMPSINSKRTLEEIAAAEDSNDDDYDDRAPSSSRAKPRRSQGAEKHVRKKQRRTYRGSDVTMARTMMIRTMTLSGKFMKNSRSRPTIMVAQYDGLPGRPSLMLKAIQMKMTTPGHHRPRMTSKSQRKSSNSKLQHLERLLHRRREHLTRDLRATAQNIHLPHLPRFRSPLERAADCHMMKTNQ